MPDVIVVFITKNSKTLLKKELFDDGVWTDMRKCLAREGIDIDGKLIFGETSIRSIPDARDNEVISVSQWNTWDNFISEVPANCEVRRTSDNKELQIRVRGKNRFGMVMVYR